MYLGASGSLPCFGYREKTGALHPVGKRNGVQSWRSYENLGIRSLSESMERRVSFQAEKEDSGMSVGQFLAKRGLTRRQISAAKFREEGICLNGEPVYVVRPVSAGDMVTIRLETKEEVFDRLVPQPGPVKILYEDEDLIAAEKPAGLASHPCGGHYQNTMANRMAAYFAHRQEQVRIRAIGRLDRETSGVMVFAKNRAAAGNLFAQKERGCFQKTYLALVSGRLSEREGVIDRPIGKGKGICMRVTPEGKRAITEYRVLRAGEVSALLVRIRTGRTHQIRVHMASIGHPLLGDALYGGDCTLIDRTALHAWKADLKHPFTGRKICLEAELPADMSRFFPL